MFILIANLFSDFKCRVLNSNGFVAWYEFEANFEHFYIVFYILIYKFYFGNQYLHEK